jgi:hypothetical protein
MKGERMNQNEWNNLQNLLDVSDLELRRYLPSNATAAIRQELKEASKGLPENYSVSLKISVVVFDSERERELPLLQTGLTTSAGKEPYAFTGDSTEHRYIVDGKICVVPHDHCPNCWGVWDFKFKNETCPNCTFSLGKEVKLLLDENICPNCEQGKVTRTNPVCTKCKYEIDLSKVVWG